MKPLVGISCCSKLFGPFGTPNHAASDTYVRAVDQVAGAVPVLLPANGARTDCATLLTRLDGIVLTGSRSNVQPSLYGGPPHEDGTPEDAARDGTTIPLIRAALAAGVPLLAVCRGLQELNVALGGTLHQRVQDLPGRLDHSTPRVPEFHLRTAKAHSVSLTPGGWLHRLTGETALAVNSLHHQAIDRLGASLVVDARAPDGTIEAVWAPRAPGYVAGVQWHPEFDLDDPASHAIFADFGHAVDRRMARAPLASAAA